jgi:hypothetical protein
MKKIITAISLICLLVVPMISLAAEKIDMPAAPFEDPSDLLDTITNIGNWIFTGLLILAGIFLVIAGYFFVTAGGNPENVNKARQMLINALIGVAVGVAAQGLKAVIQNIVQG